MAINTNLPLKFNFRRDYFTPGIYYWTCPPGIYWLKFTGIGGGASGTTPATNPSFMTGGTGGGSGALGQGYIKTIPNNLYTIYVGSGGVFNTIKQGLLHAGDNTQIYENNNLILNIGGGFKGDWNNINSGGNITNYSSNKVYIIYNIHGGNGGTTSMSWGSPMPSFASGGGAGIGSYGENAACEMTTSRCSGIGGAGGGFLSNPGVAYIRNPTTGGNILCGGGGAGINRYGGTPILNLEYGGGGASVFDHGFYFYGGSDIEGTKANGANATSGKGGGGGGSKTNQSPGYLGSGYQFPVSLDIKSIPSHLQLFYYIFGTVCGGSGGSYVNALNQGCRGQDSPLGGCGAISSYQVSTYGFRGGNSLICGGGGGAVGLVSTAANIDNISKGGNGAAGGGGGGGLIPGNGGNGLCILEW